MLSFARSRPLDSDTPESTANRPTKCRYARVDKAAFADYAITSCRATESARNHVDGKHTSFYEARSRPPRSLSRTYITELRGNPVGLRFRYFRNFRAHHPRYRTFALFFFLPLRSYGWLPRCETERPDTVAKNEICSVIASRVKTIHR